MPTRDDSGGRAENCLQFDSPKPDSFIDVVVGGENRAGLCLTVADLPVNPQVPTIYCAHS